MYIIHVRTCAVLAPPGDCEGRQPPASWGGVFCDLTENLMRSNQRMNEFADDLLVS